MKKAVSLDRPKKTLNFRFCAGLLAVLLASILARDIGRPFYGLHSWGDAGCAWKARCYLKYSLQYTKGFSVWAVGDPPTENPNRALDHPQLGLFLPAVDMALFGADEKGLRIGGIIRAVAALLIFLKILHGLLDERTALLAGLLYVLFPVIGYFGVGIVGVMNWDFPLSLLALWSYLVITRSLKAGPEPERFHKWLLAISLFLSVQISWCAFFYAMAIGVHFVFRCIHRRTLGQWSLLAILILAPLCSLMLDFVIISAGHNWQWQKIVALYKWRSARGELDRFVWSLWFTRMWDFAVSNFTLPVLITAIAYLTLGQLFVFTLNISRPLPQFWLFIMPGLFQMFILRGSLWQHQFWQSPLAPFVAIACALGVISAGGILSKINQRLTKVGIAALLAVIFVSCTSGLNYYYAIRWQSPQKIEMLRMLNKNIPPDKALLSFEDFMVNQHPVKGPHYRPEIAWYLDRQIVKADTLAQIKRYAQTGRFPYYLIPANDNRYHTEPLVRQLSRLYKYQYVPGHDGETDKHGRFLRAGMPLYMIFDLSATMNKS